MLARYEMAVAALVDAAGRAPQHRPVHQWLDAAYAQLGELGRAREEAAAVLQIEPNYTIRGMWKYFSPFKRSVDTEHLYEGLRKAGLPDE